MYRATILVFMELTLQYRHDEEYKLFEYEPQSLFLWN